MDTYNFFRNVCSPLRNKDITAFLRHPEQCWIPPPQIDFSFTNLSRLVIEIFKFFKKHVQNLNTPQNNSVSWDLQMGFNSAFKWLHSGLNSWMYGALPDDAICLFLPWMYKKALVVEWNVLSLSRNLYNPPPNYSHHSYLWRWRQRISPKHMKISSTATWHQNWEEKIQTGGKFWWKEMLQLKPSLETA